MINLYHRLVYYSSVTIWRLIRDLINKNYFSTAYFIWEIYFIIFSKPKWNDWHSQISNFFYFHGKISEAKNIYLAMVIKFNRKGIKEQYDLLKVRFLREFPTAIGHIAEVDNYVKMTILGARNDSPAIMIANETVSNNEYLAYWGKYFLIINNRVAYSLLGKIYPYIEDRIAGIKDKNDNFFVDYEHELRSKIQQMWELQKRKPLLKFENLSVNNCWNLLEANGIPKGSKFVTLHVRCDGNFQRAARDADISTYISSILLLRKNGYYVIRSGDKKMPKIQKIEGVWDYAHSETRSEILDIFVISKANFMITTTSGPAWVAPTFGVPCLNTNVFPLVHRSYFHADIYITKLIKSTKEGKYLSFKEILENELFRSESIEYLNRQGYEIINNEQDEIENAVSEMMKIISGEVFVKEQINLMNNFEENLSKYSPHKNSKISPYFAKKWSGLF